MQRAVKLKYFRFQQVFPKRCFSLGPDATLGDLIRYVNRDSFTPLGSRVVKQGVSINTGNGSLINQQYMANNDYKMNNILKIDVTPYLYMSMTIQIIPIILLMTWQSWCLRVWMQMGKRGVQRLVPFHAGFSASSVYWFLINLLIKYVACYSERSLPLGSAVLW